MGDVCLAMPLIDALGAHVEVDWLIRSGREALLRLFPTLRCRPIPVDLDRRGGFPSRAVDQLATDRYDALIDLSNWRNGAVLARRLNRIPIRSISYDRTRPWLPQRFVNALPGYRPFNRVVTIPGKVHRAVRWQRLIEETLGLTLSVDWPLRLLRHPSDPVRLFVHPHASMPRKTWPVEHFVTTVTALSNTRRVRCVVNPGLAHERPAADRLAADLRSAGVDVALMPFDSSFVSLRDALLSADLAFGLDSGPMHLASLLGTSTVVIYGPYAPSEVSPLWRSTAISPPSPRPARTIAPATAIETLRRVLTADLL